jgi:hypothetical protein
MQAIHWQTNQQTNQWSSIIQHFVLWVQRWKIHFTGVWATLDLSRPSARWDLFPS